MSKKRPPARRRRRRQPQLVQLTLDSARKPQGRGGWRPNAGRPKGRSSVPHEARAEFSASTPQHVTLKLVGGLTSLRDDVLVPIIRTQIALGHKVGFRIVEFCVQHDHLHFIVEADGHVALGDGVHAMKIRFARRINRAMGRRGELFEERYHSRSLVTPREVRNALRYVLNNERHHADKRGEVLHPHWLDPYSSAPWFEGWATPIARSMLPAKLIALPRPTMPATVWLLGKGWKRHGLIEFDEVPGRKSQRRATPSSASASR